ncbi:Thioredoxin reductase carring response regulator receiver domain [Nitrospira japonica]|uniref:Thioredoxin reductase carring response regulator receiver domain n=1 Tax=Nitrospira japonica TaxID=1325564 RepID=A0A1W1I8S1_9BACT|nr:response regulator [Nitrospira japonica]SLM49406.1 Thioredoxin reductase carring response regulator receiver domain [Nitrospira japonica]
MKPFLVTVDDDPEVSRAVERDLRRRFAEQYRILRAESGPEALVSLEQLKLRNDTVALFLVDQRMPQMTGVEFLAQAITLFPDAKRILLTAYADTDAAIRAINDAQVDYYLMKPWHPPEERLYPIIDDLLEDWRASFKAPFQGIRVLGHRWSPQTHQIKEFLAKNQLPYQWLDVEKDAEAEQLLQSTHAGNDQLPVVVFPDGSSLIQPTTLQVAEKVGFRMKAEQPLYDLIVIGAGPAGLAAAVYGGSEGLKTVLIEREAPGGQAGMSSRIENYLGFPAGLSGQDLARRALTQAQRFGVEILNPQQAVSLRVAGPARIVTLADGSELSGKTVLITTGVSYRTLDVPGMAELTGAGVYYGAGMTEALASKGEDVFIIGGANSAGQAAVYFASHARQVTMLVRGDSLTATMSHYLIERLKQTPNILVETSVEVAEACGTSRLESLVLQHAKTRDRRRVQAQSLFILIGASPHTDWLGDSVLRDEYGFILSGPDLVRDGCLPSSWPLQRPPYLFETSVPGIFVAGDARHGSIKRVASGVGEGTIAEKMIERYLDGV